MPESDARSVGSTRRWQAQIPSKKKKKKKVLLLYKGWQKHTLAVDENFSWCSDSSKFVTNSDKTRCVIYISSIFRPTYILLWFSFKYQNNNKNTRTKKCGAPLTKKQKTYIMHPPPPPPPAKTNKKKPTNKLSNMKQNVIIISTAG